MEENQKELQWTSRGNIQGLHMECEDTQVCLCWFQPPQQETTLTRYTCSGGSKLSVCADHCWELSTTVELWKVVWKQSFMQGPVEERHVVNRKETGSTSWLKEQPRLGADFGPGQIVHYEEKTCHQYSVGGLQYLQTHLGIIWLTGPIQPLASCSCLMIEQRTDFVSSCH